MFVADLRDSNGMVIQANSNNVNAWPAMARQYFDDIIVVGAVDNNGEEASISQGRRLMDV